jgi:hypothetical protein
MWVGERKRSANEKREERKKDEHEQKKGGQPQGHLPARGPLYLLREERRSAGTREKREIPWNKGGQDWAGATRRSTVQY